MKKAMNLIVGALLIALLLGGCGGAGDGSAALPIVDGAGTEGGDVGCDGPFCTVVDQGEEGLEGGEEAQGEEGGGGSSIAFSEGQYVAKFTCGVESSFKIDIKSGCEQGCTASISGEMPGGLSYDQSATSAIIVTGAADAEICGEEETGEGKLGATVTLASSDGQSQGTAKLSFIIKKDLEITDEDLGRATVDESPEIKISVKGGSKKPENYKWELVDDSSYPPGMEIQNGTKMLSGTALQAGVFTFKVRLTDGNQIAVKSLTFTVDRELDTDNFSVAFTEKVSEGADEYLDLTPCDKVVDQQCQNKEGKPVPDWTIKYGQQVFIGITGVAIAQYQVDYVKFTGDPTKAEAIDAIKRVDAFAASVTPAELQIELTDDAKRELAQGDDVVIPGPVNVVVEDFAGHVKSIAVPSITFKGDPCVKPLEVVTPAEPVEVEYGKPVSYQLKVKGGSEDFTWTTGISFLCNETTESNDKVKYCPLESGKSIVSPTEWGIETINNNTFLNIKKDDKELHYPWTWQSGTTTVGIQSVEENNYDGVIYEDVTVEVQDNACPHSNLPIATGNIVFKVEYPTTPEEGEKIDFKGRAELRFRYCTSDTDGRTLLELKLLDQNSAVRAWTPQLTPIDGDDDGNCTWATWPLISTGDDVPLADIVFLKVELHDQTCGDYADVCIYSLQYYGEHVYRNIDFGSQMIWCVSVGDSGSCGLHDSYARYGAGIFAIQNHGFWEPVDWAPN